MGDVDDMFLAGHEGVDTDCVERILRHSCRRQQQDQQQEQQDVVTLVQLPNTHQQSHRRATVVNTATTGGGPTLDPVEWHFRNNTPDLRTSLVQQGAVDDLSSRRKSRVAAGADRDQLVLLAQDSVDANRWPTQAQAQAQEPAREPARDTEAKIVQWYSEGLAGNNAGPSEHDVPVIDTIMGSVDLTHPDNRDMTDRSVRLSASGEKPSTRQSRKKSTGNVNNETVLFPAQTANSKSPFKAKDEFRPRPSSRVRVLIMLDEIRDGDSLEDDYRRKRNADGDRRGGRGQDGVRTRTMDSTYDETRKEYISDESPLKDKRKDKSGRGNGPGDSDYDTKKVGGMTRGRPGDYGDVGRGKKGGRPGDYDDVGRDKRGGRPGDYNDDGRGKKGGRPGDYNGDGRGKKGGRPGDYDDDGRGKRGGRPGDKDYDRKYGGRKGNGGGYDDGYGDDGGKDIPGYGRYMIPADAPGKTRSKPGGDPEGTKYRMVTMPKSATTLSSRRRYHIQITDHDMKEPWFNSCFNISKENNVDFNYEGPVKITPYYVGDKFS